MCGSGPDNPQENRLHHMPRISDAKSDKNFASRVNAQQQMSAIDADPYSCIDATQYVSTRSRTVKKVYAIASVVRDGQLGCFGRRN